MDAQALLSKYLPWILSNFSFCMLMLAIIVSLLHRVIFRHAPESGIVYRWTAFFALGFTSIFAFVMHAYYPEMAAHSIGWQNSPFQFEVATADLAFGMLGILSFNASFGFRAATTIAATIFLWGDAIGHISQMVLFHNFSLGNAGTWFWVDIAVPFILILCMMKMNREQAQ